MARSRSCQVQRLEGLGAWLSTNGEAIFGTRPWDSAEGETREGIGVRFTRKPDALYAILLAAPPRPRSRSAACSPGRKPPSGYWETGRPLPGDRRPTASPSPCPRCFRLRRRCR